MIKCVLSITVIEYKKDHWYSCEEMGIYKTFVKDIELPQIPTINDFISDKVFKYGRRIKSIDYNYEIPAIFINLEDITSTKKLIINQYIEVFIKTGWIELNLDKETS
jgi:hypothetical protein